MKIITVESIKTLNPCSSGILDFETKHPDFKGSISDLLMLDDISYANKIWLVVKVVDYRILQQWSLDCALMVADNYTKDDTIKDCLEVVRKVLLGELPISAAYSAARSADSAADSAAYSAYSAADSADSADSAAYSAAYSAARSADSAAYSAAYSAARSADSAAYSAADSAAYSAAYSAADSAARSAYLAADSVQEDLNISLLIALL